MYEYGELKEKLEAFLGESQRMSLGLDYLININIIKKIFSGNSSKRKRMTEDVQSVTPGKIPIWFRKMVYGEEKIPNFIKPKMKEKAEEIYKALYPN